MDSVLEIQENNNDLVALNDTNDSTIVKQDNVKFLNENEVLDN